MNKKLFPYKYVRCGAWRISHKGHWFTILRDHEPCSKRMDVSVKEFQCGDKFFFDLMEWIERYRIDADPPGLDVMYGLLTKRHWELTRWWIERHGGWAKIDVAAACAGCCQRTRDYVERSCAAQGRNAFVATFAPPEPEPEPQYTQFAGRLPRRTP